MTAAHELEVEREYVEGLYRTIDAQREAAIEAVRPVLLERQTGFGAQFERDRLTEAIDDLRHHLDLNVNGLCFGKLVATETHATTYIGRISLNDDHGDPLLVDWRAPVASAFYQATAIDPMGVMLRRHLIMAGRDLVGIEDDLLTVDALGSDDETRLVGEAALLAALTRERTGHMGDIVATIQRDQDEIIRTPLRSTLVVTGGPGTGKTVVALHRAAYLLYAYRHRIANNGVLVVGPSNLFLRYIERVLPSLGESSVVLIDWSDLVPGMTGQAEADPAVADLKGSLSMVEVLRRAVRLFERAPAAGVRIIGLDGMSHLIDTATLVRLRAQARAGDHPHNVARRRFERLLRREMGLTDTTESGYSDVCRRSVAAAASRLWPVFEPDELLGHLFANERVLAAAARGVLEPGVERALLREAGSAWTVSDLPLLDELRVLLGSSPRRESASNRAQYEAELQDAQQAIKDLTVSVAATCGGANIPVDAIVTPE
ncbi:MAG: HelD family protein, partial [Ilumatobacteraceae bacterium]